MHCMGNIEKTDNPGKYLGGVCRTGVGSNSIFAVLVVNAFTADVAVLQAD